MENRNQLLREGGVLNLLTIKELPAFHRFDGNEKIKAGIQYDVNCLIFVLDRMSNRKIYQINLIVLCVPLLMFFIAFTTQVCH